MSSLLCVRVPGGDVTVHDKHVIEDLATDANDYIQTMFLARAEAQRRRLDQNRPQSMPNPRTNKTLENVDPEALIGHSLKLQEWLSEKQVKALQERTDIEAKETKKMYDTVLNTEDSFVKNVEDFIHYKEMLDLRKKEMLHKKWNEQVYEPIRDEIDREINSIHYSELSKRKRELHKEYLEHVNKKGHVFLDTIAPDEYYALSLHPCRPGTLTAHTPKLRDPLLFQERTRSAEDRIVFRCLTGATLTDREIEKIRFPPLPLVPLGRHGTGSRTWIAMPMSDIESPVRQASSKERGYMTTEQDMIRERLARARRTKSASSSLGRDTVLSPTPQLNQRRMTGCSNRSRINLAAWAKMPHDPHVVDHEMQMQKKRRFPDADRVPNHRTPSPTREDIGIQVG